MSLAQRVTAAMLVLTSAVSVPVLNALTADAAVAPVTGIVFQDFNMNGVRDTTVRIGVATDVGVAGVTVRAFGSDGALVAQTVTSATGAYSLDVTSAGTALVRIEFAIPDSTPALDGLQPSFASATGASGSSSGTTVQFAKSGDTGVNLGVARPGEYCQNNPTLVTCTFEQGTGSTGAGAFTFTSAMPTFGSLTPNSSLIGASDRLGSVFGIGIDRQGNSFYGTSIKRHIEYGDGGATNTIYRINSASPGTVTQFVTLPGALPPHDPTAVIPGVPYSGDTGIFEKVGRAGLGGVEVTPDGKELLAVDMEETDPTF
ncbi:MAG: SdrD B-like domain-containing protein, partial [Actinomycetes bacterium]